ncbi:ACP phosphodiesterase [Marinospirillum insulare]|nr:ACP phosphodiesterase [Marinospirillum insulare]
MNYLAHLHLGGSRPNQLLGSLYGDFVKGPLKGHYPAELEAAIHLHRRLDAWTDQHPLITEARLRFSPELRRYSGIVLDVFFDHALAVNWASYSHEPLAVFTQNFYKLLAKQTSLPGRLVKVAPWIIEEDWLGSYQEFEILQTVLKGISYRLKQPGVLAPFWPELEDNYLVLLNDFQEIYPQLIEFAEEHWLVN